MIVRRSEGLQVGKVVIFFVYSVSYMPQKLVTDTYFQNLVSLEYVRKYGIFSDMKGGQNHVCS